MDLDRTLQSVCSEHYLLATLLIAVLVIIIIVLSYKYYNLSKTNNTVKAAYANYLGSHMGFKGERQHPGFDGPHHQAITHAAVSDGHKFGRAHSASHPPPYSHEAAAEVGDLMALGADLDAGSGLSYDPVLDSLIQSGK